MDTYGLDTHGLDICESEVADDECLSSAQTFSFMVKVQDDLVKLWSIVIGLHFLRERICTETSFVSREFTVLVCCSH